MSTSALIVVDMLRDFVDENGALYCGDSVKPIVPFIRERLDVFRGMGATVIYLRDAHDENDKEFERFPAHCVAGSAGSEIIPELAPAAGERVIPKKTLSGFVGTNLAQVLADGGSTEVEVVGVCTSICVMDLVGGLTNRGYKVTVPIRGVADFDPEFHQFALKRMERTYGVRLS